MMCFLHKLLSYIVIFLMIVSLIVTVRYVHLHHIEIEMLKQRITFMESYVMRRYPR